MESKYCLVCGKEIPKRNYKQNRYNQLKYCSRDCVVAAHKANNHPWRGRGEKCISIK